MNSNLRHTYCNYWDTVNNLRRTVSCHRHSTPRWHITDRLSVSVQARTSCNSCGCALGLNSLAICLLYRTAAGRWINIGMLIRPFKFSTVRCSASLRRRGVTATYNVVCPFSCQPVCVYVCTYLDLHMYVRIYV